LIGREGEEEKREGKPPTTHDSTAKHATHSKPKPRQKLAAAEGTIAPGIELIF
jgi:hypothetical protein